MVSMTAYTVYSFEYIVNGGYIAHGRFFQSYISKFASFGVTVKVAYSNADNKFLKAMKEKRSVKIAGNFLEESDLPEDLVKKEELLKIAHSIKGAKGPSKLVFADKDHWAIEID